LTLSLSSRLFERAYFIGIVFLATRDNEWRRVRVAYCTLLLQHQLKDDSDFATVIGLGCDYRGSPLGRVDFGSAAIRDSNH
jgi:hypothetical protein